VNLIGSRHTTIHRVQRLKSHETLCLHGLRLLARAFAVKYGVKGGELGEATGSYWLSVILFPLVITGAG